MTNRLELTRRDVLRGLGGLALTGIACRDNSGGADEPSKGSIASAVLGASIIPAVANRALLPSNVQRLPVQAYAQNSVVEGDTVEFRVSSTAAYQLSVVRLGWDLDSSSKDSTVFTFPVAGPAEQPIRPGSYIHVERALPSTTALSQLTLECWVRPFRLGWQGLITQYTFGGSCGFGLFVTGDGTPGSYFGNGGVFDAGSFHYGNAPLVNRVWSHVAAVFNGGVVRLYVNGALQTSATGTPTTVTPGTSPLRIGAYGDDSGTMGFLDGDLAMPVIHSIALSAGVISQRAQRLAPPTPPGTMTSVEGCWPLSVETGADVEDVSTSARHGVIVNRGTWMIGGPTFDASLPPQNPTDPSRGHGLRLSASDLHDCAWQVTQQYTIPSELRPGLYVGRIPYVTDDCFGQPVSGLYDVPFVVRRPPSRPPAPIVVLAATNTWHAYNKPLRALPINIQDGQGNILCQSPGFGIGFGFYLNHPGGQPTYLMGINMPWEDADVTGRLRRDLVVAERYLHVWLEQNGYDFDVISDHDLHSNAAVLGQYRVLFIVGHSEYWSKAMYAGVQSFLANGGQVICASGNTMFWRVSFDASTMECRKVGPPAATLLLDVKPGEGFHQLDADHALGGLMRVADLAAWKLVGLDCVGFDGLLSSYKVICPEHAFFQIPESAGLDPLEPQLGGPRVIGGEWDTTLRWIPGAPDRPSSYTPRVLARGRRNSPRLDYQLNPVAADPDGVVSEVTDWVRSEGGRVFAVGSIGASAALMEDRSLAVTFRNALHAMGVVFRLNVSAIGTTGHLLNNSFDGTSWSASWLDMGTSFRDPPTGVMWAPGQVAVMAVSANGTFYYNYFDGINWSGISSFGGGFKGRPAAVAWGRNRLTLFARVDGQPMDDHLYERTWDGTTWSAWRDLGGGVASDPTAAVWDGNNLSVAVRSTTGSILYKYNVGGAWYPSQTTWDDMGGSFDEEAPAPTLFAWNGNSLWIFAVDSTGHVYNKSWDGHSWSPSFTTWEDIGAGPVASRLAVAAWGPSQFTLFGRGTDGRIKNKWRNGNAWEPSLPGWSDELGGAFVGDPAATSFRGGSIELMAVTEGGHLQHRVWDGMAWSAWTDLGGGVSGSPAVFRWV